MCGEGGNIYDKLYSLGGLGECPPDIFGYFRALRQLLAQSEAKILIELLNIMFRR